MPVGKKAQNGQPATRGKAVIEDFLRGYEWKVDTESIHILPPATRYEALKGLLSEGIRRNGEMTEEQKEVDLKKMTAFLNRYSKKIKKLGAVFGYMLSDGGVGGDNITIIEKGKEIGKGKSKLWVSRYRGFLVIEAPIYGNATIVCEDSPEMLENLKKMDRMKIRKLDGVIAVEHEGDEGRYNWENDHVIRVLEVVEREPERMKRMMKGRSYVELAEFEGLKQEGPAASARQNLNRKKGFTTGDGDMARKNGA